MSKVMEHAHKKKKKKKRNKIRQKKKNFYEQGEIIGTQMRLLCA